MPETQREPAPRVDDGELSVAMTFLDFARAGALKKCDGLSEEDLRRRMVPTGTSILRLIRHLTDGERFWFGTFLLGVGEEPDWDAAGSDNRQSDVIIAEYRAAIEDSNRNIRQVGDPAAPAAQELDGSHQTLRWVLAHMITETARHAGHADIVRELIDGVTGR